MNTIHIIPHKTQDTDNLIERACDVVYYDGKNQIENNTLWFKFKASDAETLPEFDDCDSYLLAVIMDAMQEGRDLHVKGSVSAELLSNLVEYQYAWNKWLPDTYHIIDVHADTIRKNEKLADGAVCAFSGGVDATFSVWMHTQKKNSHRAQDIKFCSLVHGFDIPLSDIAAYDKALSRASSTLKELSLDIIPISTNYKELAKSNWEHSFSCALVAVLSNFKKMAGTCLIGSSEPYDSLVIPWGSSPLTDHLLSSGEFKAMHDGASHSRTEKVASIAEWKQGCDDLRVCWEGDLKDRNCCKCEKCMRTMLNFMATGNTLPTSLSSDENLRTDLEKIMLKNAAVKAEWSQILSYMKANNTAADWQASVQNVIKRKTWKQTLFPEGSPQKRTAKKLKAALSS